MPDDRPNIVVIMIDDADRKVLEHSASDKIRQLMATPGATATRYLINQPLCGPSRASFLRGRYPHNTGVVGNTDTLTNFNANNGDTDNFGVWLHDDGYRTGYMGKYLNGYKVPATGPLDPPPPGWDYWFAVDKEAYDGFSYHANFNGTRVQYGTREQNEANYLTDVLARRAEDFIGPTPASTKPFLLVVTPMAPHSPATPAPRDDPPLYDNEMYPTGNISNPSFNEDNVTDKPYYISMLDKFGPNQVIKIHDKYRRRLRCMESIGDLVEAIINKLDEVPDRLANTYIFFTSDHGFHMGEHRLGRDEVQDLNTDEYAEAPGPGGKNTMYEEDIRVPLWVRGPGITPGSTFNQLVGNVDLASTFRDIAGLAPPPTPSYLDGRSILPLLHGGSPSWRTRYLITRGQNKPYKGIRMANETVFAELVTPANFEIKGEYYDLKLTPLKDPYQLENGYLGLDGQSNPTLAYLQAKVAAYYACSGDSCRVADSSA